MSTAKPKGSICHFTSEQKLPLGFTSEQILPFGFAGQLRSKLLLQKYDGYKKVTLLYRRLGAKGSYLTLVRVADRIL